MLRVLSLLMMVAVPRMAFAGADVAPVADLSPDGAKLAVSASQGLRLVDVASGRSTLIAQGSRAAFPCWSPNGRRLLFVVQTEPDRPRLMLYDARTGKVRAIGVGFMPPFTWREDSARFAAVLWSQGMRAQLVWYDLHENGVTQRVSIADHPAGSTNDDLAWVPDTDNLVYRALTGKGPDILMLEGGELRKITTGGDVVGMGLSADRKKLLWARHGTNLHYILLSVYAFDLRVGSVQRLGFPARVAALNPNPRVAPISVDHAYFSPAGNDLVLIVKQAGAAKAGPTFAAYAMHLDGSNARLLLRVPASEAVTAAWERDGKQVAVSELGAKSVRTWLCDPETGESRSVDGGK